MKIRFSASKQSIAAGILAVAVISFGSIGVYLIQRAHGFTHPLFLILGIIMGLAGIPIYIASRQNPPSRSIGRWVFVVAAGLSFFVAAPSIKAAWWLSEIPNSYLAFRAWLLAVVALMGVYFLLVFVLGSYRGRGGQEE